MKQNNVDDRIGKAYSEFMIKLFGSVPADPHLCAVDRDTYDRAMKEVQESHGLKQGDPDFLEWLLTIIGRSPMLIKKGDIVYGGQKSANSTTATGEGNSEDQPMGEASSGEAD